MPEQLSPEEETALRELARDLIAMKRVQRKFTMALLWFSGIVAAVVLLWDQASSLWGHK